MLDLQKRDVRNKRSNEKLKIQIAELRLKIFERLGKKCARCGFLDMRALQIDHKNGNGSFERRELGYKRMYEKIIRSLDICERNGHPEDSNYQLLCANCQWIKRIECNETSDHGGPDKFERRIVQVSKMLRVVESLPDNLLTVLDIKNK